MADLTPVTSLYGSVYDNPGRRTIQPVQMSGSATTPNTAPAAPLPPEFWSLSGSSTGKQTSALISQITSLQNSLAAAANNPKAKGVGKAQAQLTALQGQLGAVNPTAANPNDPNGPLPDITYSSTDPTTTLAQIIQRNQIRQERNYQPVENQLIDSLKDTSILDDARKQAVSIAQDGGARAARQASRYNLQMTPEQKMDADRKATLSNTLAATNTLNTGRAAQADRNDTLRASLINLGRGYATDATGALTGSANNQTQIANANRAQKAASDAAQYQTYGTAASALLAYLAFA